MPHMPHSLSRKGWSSPGLVMTPPPFGNPATSPREALGLCAPALRRVCLYRGAEALASANNCTNLAIGYACAI